MLCRWYNPLTGARTEFWSDNDVAARRVVVQDASRLTVPQPSCARSLTLHVTLQVGSSVETVPVTWGWDVEGRPV